MHAVLYSSVNSHLERVWRWMKLDTPSTSQSLPGLRTRGLALLVMQLHSACKFDGVLGFLMRYGLRGIQCVRGGCSCQRHLLRRHATTMWQSAFSVSLAAICRVSVARVPGRVLWCSSSSDRSFALDRVAARDGVRYVLPGFCYAACSRHAGARLPRSHVRGVRTQYKLLRRSGLLQYLVASRSTR